MGVESNADVRVLTVSSEIVFLYMCSENMAKSVSMCTLIAKHLYRYREVRVAASNGSVRILIRS